MDKVKLYDTLDIGYGFTIPDWGSIAGRHIKTLPDSVAAMLGGKDSAMRELTNSLPVTQEANLVEALKFLKSLTQLERDAEVNEYCRQRFLRDAQVGYGEEDAKRFKKWIKDLGEDDGV